MEPSRPNIETVTDDSVTISWAAPSDNGGSDITCYMVEQRNVDDRLEDWDVVEDNVTSTTLTIGDLTLRDEYTFRVSAANKFGWSPPSQTSAMVVVKGN